MRKKKNTVKLKLWFIVLLLPVTITIYIFVFVAWASIKEWPVFAMFDKDMYVQIQEDLDMVIPEQYVPIYRAAAEQYNIPWTLLAAHHRIETRFSTMATLESPVGAVGHMQFMPCTFVGWSHPSCSGLGKGEISEQELTDLQTIKKYGGYGVDANGDDRADPYDIEDAIYSAANYLSRVGASQGQIKKAIFNYNHSEQYVEDVYNHYEQYEKLRKNIELLIDESK